MSKFNGSLVYVNGFLEDWMADRTVDGSFVDVNGLLEDRAADRGVDDSFVYVDSLLEDRAADRGANGCLVGVNGLLVKGRPMVVMVVLVKVTVVMTIFNDSFGYANVLAVTGLIASTVFALDLVNGTEVLFGDYRLGTVMVVTMRSVRFDFNTSIRVRRSSRPEKVTMLAMVFCLFLSSYWSLGPRIKKSPKQFVRC